MQTGDPRHHRTSLLLGLFAADIVFFAAHRNDQVPIRIRRDLIAIRQNLHVRVDFDAVGIVRFPRICAFCCIRLLCSGTDRRVLLHIIARIGKCSGRKGPAAITLASSIAIIFFIPYPPFLSHPVSGSPGWEPQPAPAE